MTARVVAASTAVIGAVAWLVVMTRLNPGAQWFWDAEGETRVMFESLTNLFWAGVAAIVAHATRLSLSLRRPLTGIGFVRAQAELLGLSGLAGLFAIVSRPALPSASVLLIPIVIDVAAVALLCFTWRGNEARSSSVVDLASREWARAMQRGIPVAIAQMLALGLALMFLWTKVVFDEGLGPSDGDVVTIVLVEALVAATYASFMLAVLGFTRANGRDDGSTRGQAMVLGTVFMVGNGILAAVGLLALPMLPIAAVGAEPALFVMIMLATSVILFALAARAVMRLRRDQFSAMVEADVPRS